MNTLKIENEVKDELIVILEPMAEHYSVKRGETLELSQQDDLVGYYHQVLDKEGNIVIFVEGEYTYPVAKIDGKEVKSIYE